MTRDKVANPRHVRTVHSLELNENTTSSVAKVKKLGFGSVRRTVPSDMNNPNVHGHAQGNVQSVHGNVQNVHTRQQIHHAVNIAQNKQVLFAILQKF